MTKVSTLNDFSHTIGIFSRQNVFDRWFYSGHVFYSEILKKSEKKIEPSKVDKAYFTHYSLLFFSVDMVYRLKLFQEKPSRLLKK